MACGTGARAVAVASILNNYTENQVTVRLLGGDLEIEWDREADIVHMTDRLRPYSMEKSRFNQHGKTARKQRENRAWEKS